MRLTRPQRVNLARSLFAVALIVGLWLIWNQRLFSWTATPTGGTLVREFGLVHYLRITAQTAGPFGNPTLPTTTSTLWEWDRAGLLINAMVSVVLAAIVYLMCFRTVRSDRLVGACDECGYDLTGLGSNKCPECGAAIVPKPQP